MSHCMRKKISCFDCCQKVLIRLNISVSCHSRPLSSFFCLFSKFLSSSSQMKRGALIVLEGIDRTGKTTQAARLVEALQKEGKKVVAKRFPDRTTATGTVINQYLQNQVRETNVPSFFGFLHFVHFCSAFLASRRIWTTM